MGEAHFYLHRVTDRSHDDRFKALSQPFLNRLARHAIYRHDLSIVLLVASNAGAAVEGGDRLAKVSIACRNDDACRRFWCCFSARVHRMTGLNGSGTKSSGVRSGIMNSADQ